MFVTLGLALFSLYVRMYGQFAQIPKILQTLQQVYDRDRTQAAAIEIPCA